MTPHQTGKHATQAQIVEHALMLLIAEAGTDSAGDSPRAALHLSSRTAALPRHGHTGQGAAAGCTIATKSTPVVTFAAVPRRFPTGCYEHGYMAIPAEQRPTRFLGSP